MIITTGYIEHREIKEYLGIVSADIVAGIGFTSDMVAAVKDFTGGRVSGYEHALNEAKTEAMTRIMNSAAALKADAVMGLRIDIEVFSPHGKGTMLGLTIYGTAVKLVNRTGAGEVKPFRPAGGITPGKPLSGLSDAREEKEWNNVPGTGFEWGK